MLIFAQQIRQVFLNKKKKILRRDLLVFLFNRKEKETWETTTKVDEKHRSLLCCKCTSQISRINWFDRII